MTLHIHWKMLRHIWCFANSKSHRIIWIANPFVDGLSVCEYDCVYARVYVRKMDTESSQWILKPNSWLFVRFLCWVFAMAKSDWSSKKTLPSSLINIFHIHTIGRNVLCELEATVILNSIKHAIKILPTLSGHRLCIGLNFTFTKFRIFLPKLAVHFYLFSFNL